MRIWVLTNEYEPNIIGGLGVVATQLSEAMAARGAEVTVLAKHGGTTVHREAKKGVQIIRFPRGSVYHSIRRQLFPAKPVLRWLRNHKEPQPDLLHIHSLQFAHLARHLKQTRRLPLIYTCHSLVLLEGKQTPFRRRITERQERLMQAADRILVPSDWQRRELGKHYPSCLAKTYVIENGVHLREGESSTSGKRLLFVGRLVHLKGIRELLHAMAQLIKQHPDAHLDIVGSGSAAYTASLKQQAQQLGITGHLHWLGYKRPDEVQRLYPHYSAVIVPSKQESFGLVALEALAAGVPLIATRAGGLREFVNDNTAEVIAEVTPDAIARAIESVWKEDEEQVQARAAAGQELARRYEWQRVAERCLDLFAEHLKPRL